MTALCNHHMSSVMPDAMVVAVGALASIVQLAAVLFVAWRFHRDLELAAFLSVCNILTYARRRSIEGFLVRVAQQGVHVPGAAIESHIA